MLKLLFLLFGIGIAHAAPPPIPPPAPYVAKPISIATRAPTTTDDQSLGYLQAGAIDNLNVTVAGAGCTSTPTMTFAAPATGGIQATGHLYMNGGAAIAGVSDNPGAGYNSSNPATTPTISGGGCTTEPVVVASYSGSGALWVAPQGVYQMQQSVTGRAIWNYFPTSKYPADAVANPASTATVVAGGSGYAVNDTITMPNGTVLTVATLSGSAVATANVTTAGNWPCYTSSTQTPVSTSGSGTGATFTLGIQSPWLYGLRRMTACYSATGPDFDVVRASDNTTKTINLLNDVFDISSYSNFCANTTCKISKLYDQGGQGQNATQTNTGSYISNPYQPAIDPGQTLGGIPSIYMAGASTLTLPSGVSFSGTNVTMFGLVKSFNYGGGGGFLFFFGNSGGLINANTNSEDLSFGGNGSFYKSGYPMPESPELVGLDFSGTNSAVFSSNDWEFECTGSCTSAGTQTGGNLGSNLYGYEDFSAAAAWPRALSAAERASFRAAMYQTYQLTPQARDIMLLDGDSRTWDILTTTNDVSYPNQLERTFPYPARYFNTGVSGDQASNRVSRFYTLDAPAMLTPHGKNLWVTQWIGYNDLNNGIAPSTIYGNITTFTGYVHALGFKEAQFSEIEGQSGNNNTDTNLQALNALILANTSGADTIVQEALNIPTTWLLSGNSPVSYFPATIWAPPHPNAIGYGFIANDVAAQLAGVWK